jgi:probable addiction module antidote protein
MSTKTTLWDVADHLDSKDAILGYLEAVFEDGDAALIAAALNDVARAKGMASDPALSSDTDISAVIRTLKALGLELTAKAA